ncbi:E3 ubiquitin-protein ligase LRSAM1-like isoform X1 [Schistocerca gregaria]|uniref:E3 ubiquitin-protein ligase LRSAM1-like isoform X1 n=1 Tax=Schistocerca gregaria TaxID=7010 RepID=UPI00211DD0B6|nr:E3 ubiquitin-protein ligase LRSAM1-like isoform X1 [Schistocerca gregaria]
MPLFGKKDDRGIDYKSRLEHKLYLARENPEPVFDLSDCALKHVPSGVYTLCKVFRKEALYMQDNHLTSLSGGGNLADLSLLQVLDLHNNSLSKLPDDLRHLQNLRVLNLSRNSLKQLPATVSELKLLNALDVSNNRLKDILCEFNELRHLESLDVRGNKSLSKLPTSLGHCVHLKKLLADTDSLRYPPPNIVQQGTTAVVTFLSQECGLEYIPPSESEPDSAIPTVTESDDIDWEFQAKILQLERLKEQKRREMLELERSIEEQQRKELELQNVMRISKEKLLGDLLEQQIRLEDEIQRAHRERESERRRLIEHLQTVEQTTDHMISQLLSLSASEANVEHLQLLLEKERQQEEQLYNLRQEEYQHLHQQEILNAMEALLEEEGKHEQKLREYEQDRAETTRTLLSQELENNQQLLSLLSSQDQNKNELLRRLHKDEELQRAAVGALLERGDARSWGLVQQVAIVSSQLSALTALELERRRLDVAEHVAELSEKRKALSHLLVKLMGQQEERRKQLLRTLNEMERRRPSDKESQADFWLMQYQRLLDSRPPSLVDLERNLDPALGHHLVMAGVVHCLPFLSEWVHDTKRLEELTDYDLIQAGIKSSEDRAAIKKATMEYLQEKTSNTSSVEPQDVPSAPSLPETETHNMDAECVVCLDRQSDIVFVSCGHMCCCSICSNPLTECPMCRSNIVQKLRVIMP